MFIPRTPGDIESCPAGHLSCSSTNIAVSGTDPSTVPDAPVHTYTSKPGLHRFIGIAMVIAIFVVGFALWVYFAKYPRRKLAYWCGRRPKFAPDGAVTDDITSDKELKRNNSTSNSSNSHISEHKTSVRGASDNDDGQRRGEKAGKGKREREKARNLMLQAEPRGVVKEVSGGVVMYTEVPRPPALLPPRRDRFPTNNTEWAFDHVHGVRFEARSSSSHSKSKPNSSGRS